MIRATTPLPKPPAAEKDPELLEAVLRAVRGSGPLTADTIVTRTKGLLPHASAHDIRMLLKPPYFELQSRGWVCRWHLGLQ